MAVNYIIPSEKIIDLSDGQLFNLELAENKLRLQRTTIVNGISFYSPTGYVVYGAFDLGILYQKIKKINNIFDIPSGESVKIYTSTSSNNIDFSPFIAINSDLTINSPQGRYIKIKVELAAQESTVVLNRNDFDSSESVQFISDQQLLFNGFLQLKTNYDIPLIKDSPYSDNGALYSVNLDKPKFKKIDSIKIK